jgi:phytoene synthase
MKELYDKVAYKTSRFTTNTYTTSFSLGIKVFQKRFHDPIYAIYGFVRLADEIVDTFHDYDKKELLDEFRKDTHRAIDKGISLNPVLQSFQDTVNKYQIDLDLIDTFLDSMEMDLCKHSYDQQKYEKYILGSAEVVGLMCLKVFVEGNRKKYEELKYSAMRLGSAFQKINFLRDLQADYKKLGRTYFPGVNIEEFNESTKKEIEADIEADFRDGYRGIKKLPKSVRLGVYLAYVYFYALFNKIKQTQSRTILHERIRIPNTKKYALMFSSYLRHSFNVL